MEASKTISLSRCGPGGPQPASDLVAVEEPLEIRLDGHPVAVLMRTPGDDEELAAGFLLTEGIISKRSELRKIEPRTDENRVLIFLADGVAVDLVLRALRQGDAGSDFHGLAAHQRAGRRLR